MLNVTSGVTRGLFLCFSEAVSFSSGLSGMEEQLSGIKAVYGVLSLSVCPLDMGRANSAICYGTRTWWI